MASNSDIGIKIVVERRSPGWAFEVYAPTKRTGNRGGYGDGSGRILVATGHRSTENLANVAAAREASVYDTMAKKKK